MARKAPLLGLINQGKCLAVTHRAVLSRGRSSMAALSFYGGVPLSIPARVVWSPSLPNAPLIHRWRLFDGGLSRSFDCSSEMPAWLRFWRGVMIKMMVMIMFTIISELKAGVGDPCCGLPCDFMRGQSVMPVDKDANHCKQQVFTTAWCKSLIVWWVYDDYREGWTK